MAAITRAITMMGDGGNFQFASKMVAESVFPAVSRRWEMLDFTFFSLQDG